MLLPFYSALSNLIGIFVFEVRDKCIVFFFLIPLKLCHFGFVRYFI